MCITTIKDVTKNMKHKKIEKKALNIIKNSLKGLLKIKNDDKVLNNKKYKKYNHLLEIKYKINFFKSVV